MIVENWMSKKVITIHPEESLSEAINLLKRNKIRRLPVVKDGKLVGIVGDRDLKEAAPSKATSLDIWELHYLISKIKVKSVMTRKVLTVSPKSTVEHAAIVMHDNKVGGLPVLDNKKLVGIITVQDIFGALINITGARRPSYRLSIIIPDKPGSIKEICDLMREFEFKCISILTTYENLKKGKRKIILRFQAEKNWAGKIQNEISKKYKNVVIIDETG